MENPSSICDELLASGWREYPNEFNPHERSFFKTVETITRFRANADKRGISIRLAVSNYNNVNTDELDLRRGELADGTWIMLLNYGLPKTVIEVTALIPRLLAVWEAANELDAEKKSTADHADERG